MAEAQAAFAVQQPHDIPVLYQSPDVDPTQPVRKEPARYDVMRSSIVDSIHRLALALLGSPSQSTWELNQCVSIPISARLNYGDNHIIPLFGTMLTQENAGDAEKRDLMSIDSIA